MVPDWKDERWPFVVNRFGGADGQQVTANEHADLVDVFGLEMIEPYAVHVPCQPLCDSEAHQYIQIRGDLEIVHIP